MSKNNLKGDPKFPIRLGNQYVHTHIDTSIRIYIHIDFQANEQGGESWCLVDKPNCEKNFEEVCRSFLGTNTAAIKWFLRRYGWRNVWVEVNQPGKRNCYGWRNVWVEANQSGKRNCSYGTMILWDCRKLTKHHEIRLINHSRNL